VELRLHLNLTVRHVGLPVLAAGALSGFFDEQAW
jgi:hypothetical protein